MKTIKKTTLIAAVTAMAAFAVPAMASAAVWGPVNTNKTLTSTTSVLYDALGAPSYSFACSNSLGVHVRTPASSTLDINTASFTGCVGTGYPYCPVTVTATGLPWTATVSGTNVSTNVSIVEHLQVTYGGACSGQTGITVDGPIVGGFTNSTHTFLGGPSGMFLNYMGSPAASISGGLRSWKDATNTLTLT